MNLSKFTDHPPPANGLLIIIALFGAAFLAAIPSVLSSGEGLVLRLIISFVLLTCASVVVYAFWLLHNTWYEVNGEGILVRFGRSIKRYDWGEFQAISHRPGIFALKIGWQGVTPCVRLRNGIMLIRMESPFPLFLTPTSPQEFLEIVYQFEPRLFS